MSEEQPKKRKIDLKARLSTVRSGTTGEAADAAFPPPARGSVPPPKVLSQGGLVPPPGLLAQTPFAPTPPEPSKPAAPQTIKLEVGEEVIQERKRARLRTILLTFVGLAIGIVGGFFIGSSKATGDQRKEAIKGAGELALLIEKDKGPLEDLSLALEATQEALGKLKLPTEEIKKIKEAVIPFDAKQLQGSWLAGLNSVVVSRMITYASGVEDVKATRDKLLGLLDQKTLLDDFAAYTADKDKPTVRFAVSFKKDGDKGVLAEIVHLKTPFPPADKWPDQLSLIKLEEGNEKEFEADRWVKGEIVGGEKAVAVPIDVATVPSCAENFDKASNKGKWSPGAQCTTLPQLITRVVAYISDMRKTLDGVAVPGQEVDGLTKIQKDLYTELKKIGG